MVTFQIGSERERRGDDFNQLIQYIISLSNLHGMVHKDKVVEIYNSQNEEQVSIGDIEAILNNHPEALSDAFILTHKDYFVMENIIDKNEFDALL